MAIKWKKIFKTELENGTDIVYKGLNTPLGRGERIMLEEKIWEV